LTGDGIFAILSLHSHEEKKMSNLVIIDEALANKLIDAGLDCVKLQYAIPIKIAELLNVLEPGKKSEAKQKKSAPIREFRVNKTIKHHLSKLNPSSKNYVAASIISQNYQPDQYVTKDMLKSTWSFFGVTPEFIKYGTYEMMRCNILVPEKKPVVEAIK
jgi:hypothetical protein